jgi:hypothetical protein
VRECDDAERVLSLCGERVGNGDGDCEWYDVRDRHGQSIADDPFAVVVSIAYPIAYSVVDRDWNGEPVADHPFAVCVGVTHAVANVVGNSYGDRDHDGDGDKIPLDELYDVAISIGSLFKGWNHYHDCWHRHQRLLWRRRAGDFSKH